MAGRVASLASGEPAALDDRSAAWLRALGSTGTEREQALDDLHGLLLRASRAEVHRRAARQQVCGPELDDLAHQAAADALLAVVAKLGQFQGRSRFTTWAYGFAVLEVASKLRRHWWQQRTASLDARPDDGGADRSSPDPTRVAEWHDMLTALHAAVDTVLTPHQRSVFVPVVLDRVPVAVVVDRTGSSRSALYKTVFDARRKLRTHLEAVGQLPPPGRQRIPAARAPRAHPVGADRK